VRIENLQHAIEAFLVVADHFVSPLLLWLQRGVVESNDGPTLPKSASGIADARPKVPDPVGRGF
jgi:hypothetical protein